MRRTTLDVPRLRRPAVLNAAEYWLAPARFADRCETLGDRFQVPMPATGPWLCLTHPDDVKRVFTADTDVLRFGEALAKSSPHPLVLGPSGLTNVDGAEHRRLRRVQNPPFHGQSLTIHEATVRTKTEQALARWPYGVATPALPMMQSITLEVIMAAVFGITDPARLQRLRTAIEALLREGNSRRFLVQTMIASSRPNGWDGPFPRMRRAIAAVDVVVREEIDARRGSGDLDRGDVLGVLLRTPDEHGSLLTDAELCDTMRTLLLGGHDTTATTLAWALERMARHPEVLVRADAAARDGDDEYLDAVVKETMRLRPVFPLTGRLAAEDFELPGLTVPKGTMVSPYITLVNRRPDLYDDPHAFRPERFLDATVPTYSWISFGGGRRRCLGAAFAAMESRIVLATILRTARVEPTTERSERIGRSTVTIVPARGARIVLDRRRAPARGSASRRGRQGPPHTACPVAGR
ncbi:cytochrome P450 [Mycobacterium sp. NPDC050041]|uniref:cytochrome P450 n=1 Tax=Mycobacterium sp. NPDC050041 TaxID=3364293 RepID=UPI003C2BC1E2